MVEDDNTEHTLERKRIKRIEIIQAISLMVLAALFIAIVIINTMPQ